MKKLLALALAFAMSLSLAACGGTPASTPASEPAAPASGSSATEEKEPVNLRFYNYALSETAKADWWEETIANFEAEYDWITVEPISVDYNSMVTTLTNDLASGLTADIIYGEISWVPALADAGFIDKPENVLSPDFYAGYYPDVLSAYQYNDGIYGVPHYMTNWLIFVNKDLIEAAGLSMDNFPTTETDLKTWIETLADYYKGTDVSTIFGMTTSEVAATGMALNGLYTAFGGTLFNDDGTLADLNEATNKTALTETLDFCKYLIGNGYTQENLKLKDYRAAFGAGNVCMYVDQSWGYAQIGEVDPNAANFTVTAPLPTQMGTNGKGLSLVSAHTFLFGAGLEDSHKEAIDLFIQYCTSNEVMEGYLNNIGLAFPAHENMADVKISPILEGAAKGANNTVYQSMPAALASVQTELATAALNYCVNGMSLEDTIADYITQAEYYMNQ